MISDSSESSCVLGVVLRSDAFEVFALGCKHSVDTAASLAAMLISDDPKTLMGKYTIPL
jgi:hypothetical protein